MRFKKLLCAAVAAAIVTMAFPVDSPALVYAAESTSVMTMTLDELLWQEYTFFLNEDYAGMQGLYESGIVTRYVQDVMASGSDRYILDLDGTTKAMLYVREDVGYLYFGEMQNELRHGNGTTIEIDSNGHFSYTGSYANDFPNGAGMLQDVYPDGSGYKISGIFQGVYLDGIYTVECQRSNGDICRVDMPYEHNHLARFWATLEGTGLDGTGYLWYEPDDGTPNEIKTEYRIGALYSASSLIPGVVMQYDNLGGHILNDIPPESELFAFGMFQNNGNGRIVSFTMSDLDAGLSILSGRAKDAALVAFEDLMALETDTPSLVISEDTGHKEINLTLSEMLERAFLCEDYLQNNPGGDNFDQVYALYVEIATYAITGGYDRVAGIPHYYRGDSDDVLDARALQYYEQYAAQYPASNLSQIIRDYITVLNENQLRLTDEVNQFYDTLHQRLTIF